MHFCDQKKLDSKIHEFSGKRKASIIRIRHLMRAKLLSVGQKTLQTQNDTNLILPGLKSQIISRRISFEFEIISHAKISDVNISEQKTTQNSVDFFSQAPLNLSILTT